MLFRLCRLNGLHLDESRVRFLMQRGGRVDGGQHRLLFVRAEVSFGTLEAIWIHSRASMALEEAVRPRPPLSSEQCLL